jgi:hypothetical protein
MIYNGQINEQALAKSDRDAQDRYYGRQRSDGGY